MMADEGRVVVDSEDVARLFESMSSSPDGPRYVVERVSSGEEAVRACLESDRPGPCHAIVGLVSPDMTALEFLRRLRNEAGDVRVPVVLVIDSTDQVEPAREAMRAGAQDYLVREGLTADALRAALEKAADRSEVVGRLRAGRDYLVRKRRWLRSVIDHVPNIVSIWGVDRKILYINAHVKRALGLPPEHFVGRSIQETGLAANTCDVWDARLDEAVRECHEVEFEYGCERTDGSRWYHVRLVPECDDDGVAESVLAVATDVTRFKEAAEVQARSERHLRRVIDSLPALVGVMTPDGVLVEANRTALEAASLRPADVLGKPFEETYWWSYAPGVQDRLRAAIQRALAGESSRYDVDMRVGEDRFITIDFMLMPLTDEQGVVTHLIPSAIDVTARKRTERAMRHLALREEARASELRTVLHATPAVIWIAHGRDCAHIEGNPTANRLVRVDDGVNISATAHGIDLGARGFLEFRDGARLEPDQLPLQVAAREGIDLRGTELTLRFADGSERCLYGNASPLRDGRGEVTGAIAAFIDITTLKQAEEAARTNQERFQLATEAVNGLVYDWDPATDHVTRSGALLDIVGYRPDEAEPTLAWWRMLVHPDDMETNSGLFEANVARRTPFQESEYRVRHRDGSWRYVWDRCRIVYDAAGRPVRVIGYTLDVTNRVRSEEALRESERKFRKLATSDVIGIISGDIHGGLVHVNDAFLRTLGYTREEFEESALSWTDITPSEWLEVDREKVDFARTGAPCPPYEKEFIRKDGGRVWVLTGITLLTESRDEAVAFVLDLTDRKRYEQVLRDADRRKDEFLAMLAHELRNPLAAIGAAAQVLQMKGPPDPELTWGREVIVRQVKHLSRLIEDLLDVSRITTGKIKLKKSVVDLRTVVNRAAESIYPVMEVRHHEFHVALPPHPLMALVDPSRLEQVLSNLLSNAAKFTENGGRILISGGLESGIIVLRVRDNGAGISPASRARIFELFTQFDHHPGRSQGGLGIGLALVKSLMEMLGGSVEVASEGVGRGTEFTVRIPHHVAPYGGIRFDGDREVVDGSEFLPTPARKSRVLVVDDNPDIVQGLSMMLESAGHQVRTAADGRAALEAMREFLPESVLLDLGLPGMDGFAVARAIRQQETPGGRPCTLIAISGYGQEIHRLAARAAGFDHHLLKPVEANDLLPLLESRAGE